MTLVKMLQMWSKKRYWLFELFKALVSAAIWGTGILWDFYCMDSYESVLTIEACSYVFDRSTDQAFLEGFWTLTA